MKYGLNHFTDTHLTILGLLIFFLFFIAVFAWVMWPKNKKYFKHAENLPFNSGDEK